MGTNAPILQQNVLVKFVNLCICPKNTNTCRGGDSKRSMATHICAVPLSKIVDKKKNIAQLNVLYLFIFC